MSTLVRAFFLTGLLAAAACGNDRAPTPAAAEAPAMVTPAPAAPVAPTQPDHGLRRVEDPSHVCMVNNQYMGVAQIPIEVDGRTYYGCCEMCKGRLANDAAAREAHDPVTGEVVDKATAVMASDAKGAIHYFASAESFGRYRGP